MTITPAQMRAFNAVARARSFSAAANLLGISQPAVTMLIRKLESANNVLLFERGGAASVSLTEAGRRLYVATQELEDIQVRADEALGSTVRGAGRALRIVTASPQILMPLIRGFVDANPDIGVDVADTPTSASLDRLLDREADLGLFPQRRLDSRLHAIPVVEQRLMALLPKGHRLDTGRALSLNEVAAEPLVMRPTSSYTRAMADQALAAGKHKPVIALHLESREAANEAVAANLGLGFVLEHDFTPDARLSAAHFTDSRVTVWEFALCLRQRVSLEPIRRFFAYVQARHPAPDVRPDL